MPKIVDPEQRRRQVTDAVFRVIDRDGLAAASLRAVATEAGLAIGSVRHYFDDHRAVMTFALRELTDQTAGRILDHAERLRAPMDPADRHATVRAALAEFLPLDDQRRREVVVWLEFVTAARVRPELATEARRIHDGTRAILGRVVTGIDVRRRAEGRPGLDIAVETERLAGLLDGLAMALVLQPERLSGDTALAAVDRQLAELVGTPQSA